MGVETTRFSNLYDRPLAVGGGSGLAPILSIEQGPRNAEFQGGRSEAEHQMALKARTEGLIIKELDGELAVYDEREHRAHELNSTAAAVWRKCDGETELDEIAREIAAETELPQDEEIVRMALDQLSRAGLLEQAPQLEGHISRRQVIQRLGLAGGAALLLPAVTTIVAPSRAMAQSVPAPVAVPFPVMRPTPFMEPTPSPTPWPT